jgi:hypothetical protein
MNPQIDLFIGVFDEKSANDPPLSRVHREEYAHRAGHYD